MKRIAKLMCKSGCEHELVAEEGEVFNTYINGSRYDAHVVEGDDNLTKLVLHDKGQFHIGVVVETNWR